MKIIKHGVYYNHEVEVVCDKCDCRYSVDSVIDTHVYDKPIKVQILGMYGCWREKRYYYTVCPECECKNPMTDKEYEIVKKRVSDK